MVVAMQALDSFALAGMRHAYRVVNPSSAPRLTSITRRAFAALLGAMTFGALRSPLHAAEATMCGGLDFCPNPCPSTDCTDVDPYYCGNLDGPCDVGPHGHCWQAMPECLWCCDCWCEGFECICTAPIGPPYQC
jgi:hypothetical protein